MLPNKTLTYACESMAAGFRRSLARSSARAYPRMNAILADDVWLKRMGLALGLWAALPVIAIAAIPAGDACALFTTTEVGAALGVGVSEGKHVMPTDALTCLWTSTGASARDSSNLTVLLGTERNFEQGKTPVAGILKEPTGGVGDSAYYITTPGVGAALWVKKNSVYLQIRVRGLPDDKAKQVEKTLALQALQKL